jgi:hypothetical protein
MSAFGLSTLLCLPRLSALASPLHLEVYHSAGPASILFLPPLAALLSWWLLFTALLIAGGRSESVRILLWSLIACASPWLIEGVAASAGAHVPLFYVVAVLPLGVGVFLVSARIMRRPLMQHLRRVLRSAEIGFVFASWSAVLVLAQVLWSFYQARDLSSGDRPPTQLVSSSATLSAHSPRVIWILFDELSHAQAFEHPFPGLSLPAFDRLAAQSVVFTHAIPTGYMTEFAVPALLTGSPVIQIRSSADGRSLELQASPKQRFRPLQQWQTVLGDAHSHGERTAIAGWYNPYCRLLPDVLDACLWVPMHPERPGILRTLFGISPRLAAFFERISPNRSLRDNHIAEYRELDRDALAMLADPTCNLLFLHLPAPHPLGIYDRRRGDFTDTGRSSYIDNLALADRTLGTIEASLIATGEWDRSTIILMGDHSWRVASWRPSPGWTTEDETASHGGVFDPRPAYVVKLPHQQAGGSIDRPFDAIRTRALIDALLSGQLQTPADLNNWATRL